MQTLKEQLDEAITYDYLKYGDEPFIDDVDYGVPPAPVCHNNPLNYGITPQQAYTLKLKHLRQQLEIENTKLNNWQAHYNKKNIKEVNDEWFLQWQINEIYEEVKKLQTRIRSVKSLQEGKSTQVDIDVIKAVPILDILRNYNKKVTRTGSQRHVCALRDENTPSVCIYENTNSWSDFGTGEGGSVIDLVMKLEGCSVWEAIKVLKSYI